ncbi:MAG: cytidine deaminase [Bacillota bacterium]
MKGLEGEWATLVQAAMEARERAYAPYSGFKVGAAVLAEDGTVWTGCNVENASYPLSMCAERVALYAAIAQGRHAFKAIAVAADTPEPITPCGACRQVISELAPGARVIMAGVHANQLRVEVSTPQELLPSAFALPK